MASEKVFEVDASSFQVEVLNSDHPVLVDFWAPWCGPCRQIAPVLEELAAETGDRVRFAKLNIDENQELAIQFGVQSIPTFILFDGGAAVDRMLGAMPKRTFQQMLDRYLS